VALLLAASLLWLLIWRWSRGHWLLGTVLALALILFDLITVNSGPNVQQRKIENQYRASGVIRELKTQPGPFRVHNEFRLPGNHGLAFGLEDTWGASPLRLASYERLFAVAPSERVWELLNVGYLVTWLDDIDAPSSLLYQQPAKKGEVDYVHQLEAEHPRAWTVYQVEILSDEESVLERLAEPGFDPYSVGLLTEPLDTALAGQPASEAEIRFTESSPTRLVIEIDQPETGLLVVSEIDYPGWEARVDGHRTPMIRTDAILRGVEVPAGQHRVEMVFDPLSVKLGLIVSAVTLLLSLVYVTWCLVSCVRKPVSQ
jgi:hypothetical protein